MAILVAMSTQRPAPSLLERKTRFVEIFRTTPARTVCPNFYVLSHANGCAFTPHCSYCYLKSSFWYLREQRVYANADAMLREAASWIAKDDLESYVLNMGNLSDSLVFEDVRPVMGRFTDLFRREAEGKGRPHTLLLVTKGGPEECAGLLTDRPCRNVIVSFSVNDGEAARIHESGTPPSTERLAAARMLLDRGWRVRIRIDPMIAGFDYLQTASAVRRLGPERVTLGTLRAEHGLLHVAPKELFSALEAPQEPGGLARYPWDLRLALYRRAMEGLSGCCSTGLCEETREMWEALGLPHGEKTCNCNL